MGWGHFCVLPSEISPFTDRDWRKLSEHVTAAQVELLEVLECGGNSKLPMKLKL